MGRGHTSTSYKYRSEMMRKAETKRHDERRAVEVAAGRYVRETRDGVTMAELVATVEQAGFIVSAGSYEDARSIHVFSVELQHGCWGEPKFSASYNKAFKFLSVG